MPARLCQQLAPVRSRTAPQWSAAVVGGVRLDDLWEFASTWLRLHAQIDNLRTQQDALVEQWQGKGVPTAVVLAALGVLHQTQPLEGAGDLWHACLTVLRPLLEGDPVDPLP